MSHDTTSILATIERRFGLAPLGARAGQVADLGSVFDAHPMKKSSIARVQAFFRRR